MPNDDMPKCVKEVYMEAREVFVYSKRASAALLRLALQLLEIYGLMQQSALEGIKKSDK